MKGAAITKPGGGEGTKTILLRTRNERSHIDKHLGQGLETSQPLEDRDEMSHNNQPGGGGGEGGKDHRPHDPSCSRMKATTRAELKGDVEQTLTLICSESSSARMIDSQLESVAGLSRTKGWLGSNLADSALFSTEGAKKYTRHYFGL